LGCGLSHPSLFTVVKAKPEAVAEGGKGALGGSNIIFKGCFRLLDDADVVAILGKNVVNALPAGTICPGTVNQNDIPNAMVLALCGESAAGQQQDYNAQEPRHSSHHLRAIN